MAGRKKANDPHRILNAFRTLVKALRVADRSVLKDYGVGSAQAFVLHELNRESPLSVNDVAERTATDQSTVSVVVNKLVAKGLVARSRSGADGRRAELTLTARGRHLVRRLPAPIQESLLDAVRELPSRRAGLFADALEQVVKSLGIDEDYPPMFFEDRR
jgi:DNA-binding MarR family transcriptional regulator